MKEKSFLKKNLKGFLLLIILVAAIYLIARNISAFGNILVVLLGFGAVVLFHEFGHFIVAKLSDIHVEAFSIFMPPIVLGVRRTENGFRFRILPRFFGKEGDESGDGSLSFTVGRKGEAGETEYRLGLIPFGGFVKLLGQDDTGPVSSSNDPRSFANKPLSVRVPVIAAGVIFNVISAVIIFMIVFLIGIKLPPAVVGDIVPDSPAARAGLIPGDEIIEIAGKKKDLDFGNILIAAALSRHGEAVPLRIRRQDGTETKIELVAEQLPGQPLRDFGIEWPIGLTVEKISDPNTLFERTGLKPGDEIKSVNGIEVSTSWQLAEIVQAAAAPAATILAKRQGELIKTEISLSISPAETIQVESESDLSNVCSMVPRLKIAAVSGSQLFEETKAPSTFSKLKDKLLRLFGKTKKARRSSVSESPLRSGDIIVAIDDVKNPTYLQLRNITAKYEDSNLPISVMRGGEDGSEQIFNFTVIPKRPLGGDRALIGIVPELDAGHPVVAKTIETKQDPPNLQIPSGAVVAAVNGVPVSSFYDIVREIRRARGEKITIDYRLGEQTTGKAVIEAGNNQNLITVKSRFTEFVPFQRLERLYRATSPIQTIAMGYRRTVMLIAQAYLTLKRLVAGAVSPKALMGPVGIIAFSYRVVAEQPLVDYFYFLGLISAVIAVFNFLPLPPLDGGLVVLMFIEKAKGSALSERTQSIIAYAGWVLIGTLFIYVTFNDIVRNFFS